MSTLVVLHSIGQIGNRLEQFSHLIAFARDHDCKVINPAFSLYASPFERTHRDLLCRYPDRSSPWVRPWMQRLAYYLLRTALFLRLPAIIPRSIWIDVHWSSDAYRLDNPTFLQFIKDYKWIFLSGHWKHRCWPGYNTHLNETRRHFALTDKLASQVSAHLAPIRKNADVLIGFHVRQGDNFTDPVRRDGFSSEEYAALARNIAALFPDKKVAFLLCTNKPQPMELYEGLQVHPGPGDFILDMYALAECNYIVGAGQSSFSAWASLMGNKPRYGLFDPKHPVSLSDFKICEGLQ